VTYEPAVAGTDFGEITLVCNSATSDTIILIGNAIDPPIISVVPLEITDAILIGDKADHEMIISNNGGSDLDYIVTGINFGDGSDGELIVNAGDTYYPDAVKSPVTGQNSTGQNGINLDDASSFSVGDEVLIISMQDSTTNMSLNVAGQYETHYITFKFLNAIGFDDNLQYTYDQDSGKIHQVIRIPQFTDITVDGTVTCDSWNGETGGIVFFRANGDLTVNSGGSLDVSGKGYRGGSSPPSQSNYQYGYAGERTTGVSTSRENNSNAVLEGGGGTGKGADGSGGGGGYGSDGSNGGYYLGGSDYGRGASSFGAVNLSKLYFGGGGGSSGSHANGRYGVAGGNGGGIVIITTKTVQNNGSILTSGNPGANGVLIYNSHSGAGGGGGAGGSLYISATTINTDNGFIGAERGIGGSKASNSYGYDGGNGGDGLIRIDAEILTYTGTIAPDHYRSTLNGTLPPWITSMPYLGTISIGENDTVLVTLDATILSVGDHTADLNILSNDINNDEVIIPISLTVDPGVGLVVTDTFRIDNVYQDSTEISPLIIHNVGTDTLEITNIILTDANSVFSILATSFTIPAENHDTLWVTFTPNAAQWFEASLQIFSDDPTDPVYDVVLLGNGISDPVIAISPEFFNVEVLQNDSLMEMLTIFNNGGSDLEYQLHSLDSLGAGMAASFDGNGDYIGVGGSSTLSGATGALSIELWFKTSSQTTQYFFIMDNSSTYAYEFHINDNGSVAGNVYNSSHTISTNVNTNNTGGIGGDWWDGTWHHAALVIATTSAGGNGYAKIYLDGELAVDGAAYSNQLTDLDSGSGYTGQIGMGNSSSPMNGIIDEVRIWNVARTQAEIQSYMYYTLHRDEPGLKGYWNFNGSSPWVDLSGNDNNGTAYGNTTTIESTAPINSLITFEPLSGIVPRFTNHDVEVTFYADNLDFDVYNTNIQLISNDTTQDTVLIPVSVTVPAPVMAISPDSFNVVVPLNDTLSEILAINNNGGSVLSGHLFPEVPDSLEVLFDNFDDGIWNDIWTAGGSGGSIAINNSHYVSSPYCLRLYALDNDRYVTSETITIMESSYLRVSFWLKITTSDYNCDFRLYWQKNGGGFNLLYETPNHQTMGWTYVEKDLTGSVVEGDEIEIRLYSNIYSASSSYDQLDAYIDNVTIYNGWNIITLSDNEFNVEQNSNQDIGISFIASNLEFTEYNLNLTLISNDTVNDTLLVPVTVSVPPSDISVSPPSYTVNMVSGDTTSRNLTISNEGLSDLIFEIEDTDGPGMAASFDGNGDYISLGNPTSLQITGNQTIEMWINPTNFSDRRNPYAKAFGGEGTITVEQSATVNYYYGSVGGNNYPCQGFTMTSPLQANNWTHIAIVRDLDNMVLKWYKNGVLVNETNALYSYAAVSSLTAYIGHGYTNDYYGLLDEVRVWNIARTEAEIQSSILTTLNGIEPGLTGYWNFNESNPWADLSGNGNDGIAYGNTTTIVSSAEMANIISFDNVDNTVPYNGNSVLDFLINSSVLPTGQYNPKIKIQSNDPVDNILYFPVTLNVTGAAGIAVSKDTLNFGEQFVNGQTTLSLTVRNIGSETLDIQNIQIVPDVFSYSGNSFALLGPGDSLNFEITFEPDLIQTETGEISFTSNDPTDVVKTVVLNGEGILAPEIALSPDPMEIYAITQANIIENMYIQNIGGNALEYEFYPVSKSDTTLWHYAYVLNYTTGSLSIINLETQSVTNISGFYYHPHNIDMTPDGRYLWITNHGDNEISIYDILTGSHKVISASGDSRRGTSFSPDGTIAYVADAGNNRIEVYNTTTYELLKTFVTNIDNPEGLDITLEGKYLYITDTGTNLVIILDTETGKEITSLSGFTNPWGLEISPNGKWFAFCEGDNVKIGATMTNTIINNVPGIDNPRTPVWTSDNKYLYVGSWDAYKIHKIETDTFTEVKVYNMPYKIWGISLTEDSEYLVASCANNDMVAIIKLQTDEISYVTVEDYPASITTFRTKLPIWIEEISQLSGSVEPGSNEMIDLTINTTENIGGDHYAELWFNTNDPMALDFKYDITLHHNSGSPYLVASDDSLDFGNVWVGYPDSLTLTISNTGTETLEISSLSCDPGQFYTLESQLSINANSDYDLTVYCNDTLVGFLDGSLNITSNGGSQSVYLEADAYAPPVAEVNPEELDVSMLSDTTSESVITLTNNGFSNLSYYTAIGMQRDIYYIGNDNKTEVTAWNSKTNTEGNIDVLFSGPWRMKYSPDGKYLWITYQDAGYVTVLDVNTNTVVDTINVGGSRTSGVAFNKTGIYAYVGNWSQNRIEKINTADYTWEGSITGSLSNPKELIAAPESSRLFVTNNGNDDLVVIDLSGDTVLYSIDGISTGYDLAISRDGSFVYWIDKANVQKVNTETGQVVLTSQNFGDMRGITISDDGQTIYVCGYSNDKIIALETENLTQINEWTEWDYINDPVDIILSFDRKYLFATLAYDNKVVKLDAFTDDIIEVYSLGAADFSFRDITTPGRISWLSVNLDKDTLVPGNNNPINFSFNTEDLAIGSYTADFGIYNNTPERPEIIVPVNLTVESYGDLPPGWEFTVTSSSHLITIPVEANPMIEGDLLNSGDFIGVFFLDDINQVCGGGQQYGMVLIT